MVSPSKEYLDSSCSHSISQSLSRQYYKLTDENFAYHREHYRLTTLIRHLKAEQKGDPDNIQITANIGSATAILRSIVQTHLDRLQFFEVVGDIKKEMDREMKSAQKQAAALRKLTSKMSGLQPVFTCPQKALASPEPETVVKAELEKEVKTEQKEVRKEVEPEVDIKIENGLKPLESLEPLEPELQVELLQLADLIDEGVAKELMKDIELKIKKEPGTGIETELELERETEECKVKKTGRGTKRQRTSTE